MIAISYRREDSLPVAGRLYDRLQAEFGKGNVFMDFDSIPYGVDFRDHIKQMIEHSKVLVAMIGPDWIGRRRHGNRRIDDPADFVRLEIAYALERNLPVIPILIGNTRMPRAEELPKDIEALAFRNALSLDAGIDFHHHAERLVTAINRLLTVHAPPIEPIQQQASAKAKAATTSPAPPETQLTSESLDVAPANIPTALPGQARSVEGAKQPSPVMPSDNLAGSADALRSPAQARPAIAQKPKRPAFVARSAALWRGARMKLSGALLGFDRLLTSINASVRRSTQAAIAFLRRRRKAIVLSVVILLAAFSAAAALYWSSRTDSFDRWVSASKFLVRNRASQSPALETQPSQNPSPAVTSSSESPPSTALPAPPRGVLTINSSPQGQAFEVIGADGSHRSGTTPMTLEDLPVGYAQVIFKRNGFPDHSQAVWLNPSASVTWNFPDDTRIPEPTQPNQQVSPPASPMNPSAQNGRTWQAWIGDFVRQFVVANQSPDPDPTVLCYALTVSSYYGEQNKDQAYVRHDIENYNKRWPIRHDEIEGDIHLQEKVPGQQYSANFKLNFYAESPPRNIWTKGQFVIDLEIAIVDGIPKITAIRGKTLHQHKGKPTARANQDAPRKSLPVGIAIQGKPGFVRSPYAPAKGEIDIRRYRKGSEIKCPFTGKIFIAP